VIVHANYRLTLNRMKAGSFWGTLTGLKNLHADLPDQASLNACINWDLRSAHGGNVPTGCPAG